MNVSRLTVLGAAALILGAWSSAQATIIIRTNDGVGADAEVREENLNPQVDDNFINILKGTNRGTQVELATRANNTTDTATGDTSSVMFMKFDISSLPGAADPFWTNKKVKLQLHVDASNMPGSRLWNVKPNGITTRPNDPTKKTFKDFVAMEFKVRGLEPGNVYADDLDPMDPTSDDRTDSFGNPYDSAHYEYNWDEGNGTLDSGITFYDAPGLTPHCASADYGCSVTSSIGTLEENFNSDTRLLGTWKWPRVEPANHLPVGMALKYSDPDLKQLVLDAKAEGRTTVTIMISHGLDTQNVAATAGIPATSPLLVTPSSMLAFNYIAISKNRLTLLDDPSYDADGNNPPLPAPPNNPPTGSPFSCDGTPPNPNSANCPGHLLGDNSTGAFSPKLIIQVPEPASMVLVALGTLMATALVGRRRK